MECNIAWDKTRGGRRREGEREVLQNTEIDLPPPSQPPRSPSEEGDRGKERGAHMGKRLARTKTSADEYCRVFLA